MTLEELNIKFTASMGGLTSQLSGVKRQLGMVSASAGTAHTAIAGLASAAKLFISVYLVREMFKIGKASLKMANDAVESESLFAVSMKGMAGDARAWSEELQSSLGLNAYELRRNAATFNTMFRSMGAGEKQAYDMATGLTALAEDMASFYNVNPTEMFDKLRAGITGETEPLKRIGIMVDENTTKQYALSEGISATGKELTQTEKLMARYAAIMAQTTDAQGDLARTINSPVNQIRMLNNTLNMAQITLGQAFQPIQAVILPILNSLAQAALFAASAIKTFLWALSGFTGISVGAADVAGKGAEANGELAESLNDTSKALKGAGGAAKKAAKDAKIGLKAFDEINKLTEESAGGGGGGGGGLDEKPEIVQNEKYAEALEKVNTAMSKAADWLKKVWELALPAREAMSRLGTALSAFGNIVFDNIIDFYDKFIKPIGTWTVTKALPAFLDMLSAAVGAVNTAMVQGRPVWDDFYNNILVPVGKWVGDKIIQSLNWLRGAFDSISDWIKENPDTFKLISQGIMSIFVGFVVLKSVVGIITAVQTAMAVLNGAVGFLTSPAGAITLVIAGLVMLALNWDKVVAWATKAWDSIKEAWKNAPMWIYNNITKPFADYFKGVWYNIQSWASTSWELIKGYWKAASNWMWQNVTQPIIGFFVGAWGAITATANAAWEIVKTAWTGAGAWISKNVTQPVIGFFTSAWGVVTAVAAGAWAGIMTAWTDASTWFNTNILTPISTFFTNIFSSVTTTVTKTWDNITAAWNGATTFFSNLLQPVKDAIQWIIDKWNEIKAFFSGGKLVQEVEIHYSTSGDSGSVNYSSTGMPESYDYTPDKPSVGGGGGTVRGYTFASGGVFSPNKPFLGLLGDQRNGRNIEAPEGLIRDIFREEMAVNALRMPSGGQSVSPMDTGGLGGGIVQQAVEAVLNRLQVTLNVDGQTFGKASIKAINTVQRNAGTVLFQM